MKAKAKSVAKAIPLSFLWLLAYYLIFAACGMLLFFLFTLLHSVPIVKTLVDLLFYLRGDTPYFVSLLYAAIITYTIINLIADKAVKTDTTRSLSLFCTGIYLTVFNVVFLVVNLIFKDSIIANVLIIISGLIFTFYNRKKREDS